MKDTFNGWDKIDNVDINVVADLIVTGRKAYEAEPDDWLCKEICEPDRKLTILDFGCGFGRNSYGLANYSKEWTVIGYDSENMLNKVKEYSAIKYKNKIPSNLWFISDWEQLKLHRFDIIVCMIVLQHIFPDALVKYINDFKQMTRCLFVAGRRFNDGPGNRSTWTILEEQGLIPYKFYSGHIVIPYSPDGDPGEHNNAYYFL